MAWNSGSIQSHYAEKRANAALSGIPLTSWRESVGWCNATAVGSPPLLRIEKYTQTGIVAQSAFKWQIKTEWSCYMTVVRHIESWLLLLCWSIYSKMRLFRDKNVVVCFEMHCPNPHWEQHHILLIDVIWCAIKYIFRFLLIRQPCHLFCSNIIKWITTHRLMFLWCV